jgi:hypothetical protein
MVKEILIGKYGEKKYNKNIFRTKGKRPLNFKSLKPPKALLETATLNPKLATSIKKKEMDFRMIKNLTIYHFIYYHLI